MSNLISEMEESGRYVRRGGEGYDEARRAWQLAADLHPAVVAFPRDPQEVATVVRRAASDALRVAPIATGHQARALGDLDASVLLWTSGMTGVTIDRTDRRARVHGGDTWLPVVQQAARDGLAALHGSAAEVGVIGYSLAGGIGWYARAYGLAANYVTAIELVLADGRRMRVDAQHEPALFWALRGGGAGNFGVVTALEFDLFPITTAYAGALIWDLSDAPTVLPRWAEWSATAPESVTTSYRHVQFPPIPQLPEPLRGRRLVIIDGAILEDDDDKAARLLSALRDLKPEMDTFSRQSAETLNQLHLDPDQPTGSVGGTAGLFDALPTAATDRLLEVAGPDSGTPLLVPVEIRQLGGVLGREHPGGGVLNQLDGQFLIFNTTFATDPEQTAQAVVDTGRLTTAMTRWANGREYLPFVEEPMDTSAAFPPADFAELRRIRTEVDPTALFQSSHEIPQLRPPV